MPAPWAAHAQATIRGKLHGQVTNNVLNLATNTVVNDDSTGVALLKTLANNIKDCVEQTLLPAVTANWVFEGVDVRKMAPTIGDAVSSDAPVATQGSLSAVSVSFASALVQIKTGGGGKSGIGKIYLPPPGETETTNSLMTDPAREALIIFLVCLAGKFIGNATTPWRLGVLSRKKVDNVLPPIDQRFREATQLIQKSELAIMSSRKVGRGS